MNNSFDNSGHANTDNDNTTDDQQKNSFLEVIFDEKNIIQKITFQNNRLNISNNGTTMISKNNDNQNQNLSNINTNNDLPKKEDSDNINICKIKFKFPMD